MNAPANGWKAASGPVQESERVDAIDVLRGFALLGILLVNIGFFAHPVSEPFYLAPDAGALDRQLHFLVAVFAQGKFYPLFSLLFGLGFALQLERARDRKQPLERFYVRRLLVLMAIGLVHGIFIWAGDILLAYAFVGFLLLLFAPLSARGLLQAAVMVHGLQLAMIVAFTVALEALPYVPAEALKGITAAMNEAETLQRDAWAVYANGSYLEITQVRLREFAMALQNMAFFGLQVLGMFLLGAWLGRRGVLVHAVRHRRLLKGFLVTGLGLGLPLSLAFALVNAEIDYLGQPTPQMGYAFLLNLLAGPLLALAYLAAITLAMQAGAGRWWRVLAPVGRMALTNYLLQSVIATWLFHSWGLGLFGELQQSMLLVIVLLIFSGQVIFSNAWMQVFRFGPIEWVWRCLTYFEMQPLRRSATDAGIRRAMRGWERRS